MRPLATVVPGRRPSHDADVFVLEARIAQRVHALQAMPLLEHERVSRAVYGLVTCTRSSPCGTPIMTSHLCTASVLRTKPVACGYQLYESPLPSLSASNSASLFSKPSPRSVENGMLCGSAQTLSTFGSMSSSDKSGRSTACASSFPDRNVAATAVHETYMLNRSHLPLAEFVIGLFSPSLCGVGARRVPPWRPAALSPDVQGSCFPLGQRPQVCLRAFAVSHAERRHWRVPADRRIYHRDST